MKILCDKCRASLEWRYEIGISDVILVEPCMCDLPTCSQCGILLSADAEYQPHCDSCHEGDLDSHRAEAFEEAFNEGYEEAKQVYDTEGA